MTNENETNETDIIILDPADYERDPINRADVVQFADTLMGIHPEADTIGTRGMRVVAQLAIATGANPLPGTNGIHAWVDNKSKMCIQLGIGYWRQQAEMAGGILWIRRPRPMTDQEREDHEVTEQQQASICIGALSRDVFSLLKNAQDCGFELSLAEAKNEVARVGAGIVNPGEYAKKGRSPQWTADLRAERDLLRQLVPAMSMNASERPAILDQTPAELVVDSQNHDAWALLLDSELHESTTPDDYGMDDVNADFFDDEPVNGEVAEETQPEPASNGQPESGPASSHTIADIRAGIDGNGDTVQLGAINRFLADTGLYNDTTHAFNAVKKWDGWPADGKYSADKIDGGSKITRDKALAIFDWAIERKGEKVAEEAG